MEFTMQKYLLNTLFILSITLFSVNSLAINIPACDTSACKNYFKLYKKYSKAGYADAMTTLGDLYFNGHGTDKNTDKALKEYRKGAKYGSVNGQYKTAMIYLTNKDHKDIAKGVKYLEKAARGKSKESAFLLGVIFYKKDFYKRDFERSDKWLTKAYQANKNDSADFISLIDEENELNITNYPKLLAAIASSPLPLAEEEQTLNASVQHTPQIQQAQIQQAQKHQSYNNSNLVSAQDNDMEVITITTTLHDMFSAQIESLRGSYPQKGATNTGSRIVGNTCQKNLSCGEPNREDFIRLVRQLM